MYHSGMTSFTVLLMTKSGLSIVAGSAITALTAGRLGYLSSINLHIEFEFRVTNPAGKESAVLPMRKVDRLDPFFLC